LQISSERDLSICFIVLGKHFERNCLRNIFWFYQIMNEEGVAKMILTPTAKKHLPLFNWKSLFESRKSYMVFRVFHITMLLFATKYSRKKRVFEYIKCQNNIIKNK
jgi:hypothetical protein